MLKIFLAVLAVGSILAFAAYGIDKSRARRGAWRISERALLLLGFSCGSVGALIAMKLFRHKTRHPYFYFVNVSGLVWQVTLVCYLAASGL
ncbi:MAG: DUF1294 domain-containing protein [Clostridia bacterium]|nr:DUF1294 domain-containing protein [Clostridia bacterium]